MSRRVLGRVVLSGGPDTWVLLITGGDRGPVGVVSDQEPGPDPLAEAATLAQVVFGHAALRPGQRRALAPVLAGRDTLAVLATGSGKSAIYQLAGGLTVVVSPLVALQRDQLRALTTPTTSRPRSVGSLDAATSGLAATPAPRTSVRLGTTVPR